MKIKITVYKETGKYYTEGIIQNEEDMFLGSEEFKRFIKEHIPANLGNGFIVVDDVEDNQLFHNALYRYEEIFK